MNFISTAKRHYIFTSLVVLLLIILLVIRLYFNVWLLEYVNHSLNNIKGYQGSVEDISIDFYRSAYRIHNLKIAKKTADIPVPFVAIEDTDISIQWAALLHGRIVSDVKLVKPVLNFAVSDNQKQTGENADWTAPIKALAPVDVNHATFTNGEITYRDFASNPKVDIYIRHLNGEISNLRNVVDQAHPLPSEVVFKGDSIGGGKLDIKGRMNILKKVPDMNVAIKLEDVSMPALDNYTEAYVALDIKQGSLSIYSQLIIKDGQVSGYIKPIANHVSIIDLSKSKNPIKIAWESVVAGIVQLFTNHVHDQFATKIELQGNLDDINTSTWSAIAGIVHNAFISAFKKGFESDSVPPPKVDLPPKKQ